MQVAPECAQCRTPVTSSRFCTTCGTPFPRVAPDGPQADIEAAPSVHPAPLDSSQIAAVVPMTGEVDVTGRAAVALATPQVAVAAPSAVPPWLQPQPAAPKAPARNNLLALLVLGALALSGWAIVHGVERHILSGTVTVVDSFYSDLEPGNSCTGDAGYDDVRPGAQVVVVDGKGAMLSTGRLSEGEFDGVGCVFHFSVDHVTRADFYGLTVGSGSRGEMRYSYAELSDQHWSVQLSVGSN